MAMFYSTSQETGKAPPHKNHKMSLLLSSRLASKNMVLWLLRLCVFYYCVHVHQRIGYNSQHPVSMHEFYSMGLVNCQNYQLKVIVVLYVGNLDKSSKTITLYC